MSNVNYSDLTNCDLSGSIDFANANLVSAILRGVTIDYVTDLSNAKLDGVISGDIIYVPNSISADEVGPKLPLHWKIINGYLVGPGANLVNANLANQNLSKMRLFTANFTGANLQNTKFISTALSKCNFSGADVSGAVFSNANLENTIFTCSIFSETTTFRDYTDNTDPNNPIVYNKPAILNGVISGNILTSSYDIFAYLSDVGKLPVNWSIVNGYLVGPGANLINAVL